MSDDTKKPVPLGRRGLLKGLGAAATAALPSPPCGCRTRPTPRRPPAASVEHLIYIRLAGGFRFTTAFNGDVADDFNPFGRASTRAAGTEWGLS